VANHRIDGYVFAPVHHASVVMLILLPLRSAEHPDQLRNPFEDGVSSGATSWSAAPRYSCT
jgi:hypothetical protein